jgi:hypothetical protein
VEMLGYIESYQAEKAKTKKIKKEIGRSSDLIDDEYDDLKIKCLVLKNPPVFLLDIEMNMFLALVHPI